MVDHDDENDDDDFHQYIAFEFMCHPSAGPTARGPNKADAVTPFFAVPVVTSSSTVAPRPLQDMMILLFMMIMLKVIMMMMIILMMIDL